MESLYQLSNEYQQLLDLDEYTHEDMDRLVSLNDDVRKKAIQVGSYIMNLKSEVLAIQMAIEKMDERCAKKLKKIQALTEYLKEELERCAITKIDDHPEFAISIRKGSPKVVIEDEDRIPDEFRVEKVTTSVSKTLLKDALKNGRVVEGVSLLRESSLQIK